MLPRGDLGRGILLGLATAFLGLLLAMLLRWRALRRLLLRIGRRDLGGLGLALGGWILLLLGFLLLGRRRLANLIAAHAHAHAHVDDHDHVNDHLLVIVIVIVIVDVRVRVRVRVRDSKSPAPLNPPKQKARVNPPESELIAHHDIYRSLGRLALQIF